MLPEFVRGAVAQAGTRPGGDVVAAPLFDDRARLGPVAEPLHVQALVAQAHVEALVGAVLPGLAGIDVGHLHTGLDDPLQDLLADELRTVVAPKDARCTVNADQLGKDLYHPLGADASRHVDRQALAGELVDHGQAFQRLSLGAGVVDEVVCPDAIRACRRQGSRT